MPSALRIAETSPVPKWQQLHDILLDLIVGELSVDAMVPSERQLAQRFGLSRMTARQALDHLVSAGWLYRVQGRGTFVARPKIDMPLRLASFTEDMVERGLRPGATDLDSRTVRANAALARQLSLRTGQRVHVIERLRTADGLPMAIERFHLPAMLAPDLLAHRLTGRSLYALLEQEYGIVPDEGTQTIAAGTVEPADGRLLGLPRSAAVLLLQRRSRAHGHPVEYTVSTYRADRYQLHSSLAVPTAGRARPVALGSVPLAEPPVVMRYAAPSEPAGPTLDSGRRV